MLRWSRAGRLFPLEGTARWIGGYGALPFAVPQADRTARVYFSGRDEQNRAQAGACTLGLDGLSIVPGSVTAEPLVAPGPPGAFDESGCSMSCLVEHGGLQYLYYTGWTLGRTVPFYLAVGLAVSEDGGRSFRKVSAAPVLGRHAVDPFLCASPSVLVENGTWRMWYISAVRWESTPEGPRHYYLVKYAESSDGIEWRRDGRIAIDFASADEHAIGRPHVLYQEGLYRMWYCYRGAAYRIGYAESPDGLVWTRHDDRAGFPVPEAGWDSEMQAYPMVFKDGDRWLMLYNGNGYGATGFGCVTAAGAKETGA